MLTQAFHLFKKKESTLSETQRKSLEKQLKALQSSILEKDAKAAKKQALSLKMLVEDLFPKTLFEKTKNFVIALVVALSLALLIRQTVFEFYEIPTGSMRPTLKEKDRLVVSKTSFGVNVPFSLKHFYFNPDLVQRNGIVVFSGEDMDIRDVDTMYFYLFPGKKQYVKRMIGKPGDTLYFYGGLIYGINREGLDISAELQSPSLKNIEHIPFIYFDGKAITPPHPLNGVFSPVLIYQMNEPVAKLTLTGQGQAKGSMLPITVNPGQTAPIAPSYGDLWGIKNFAMARLLTKNEVLTYTKADPLLMPEGLLYLEIQHDPNLENAQIKRDLRGRLRPCLGLNSSVIPLNESHLRTLFQNLYTARFVVKNEKVYRYGMGSSSLQNPYAPSLTNVPDGMYEFYNGKAYEISFQGISSELSPTHPLYHFDLNRVRLFYNLGIEFDTRVEPQSQYVSVFPSRYVYFKDQSLYAMGAPLFLAGDPILQNFKDRELNQELISLAPHKYKPFIDHGPPLLANGSLNTALIQECGITVPEKMYLVLGDNHAMSGDSREFGFVPEKNLKGAPDFIFWPPGPRFGQPNQPPYPFMNAPRAAVWFLVALCISGYMVVQNRRNKLPLL